MAEQLDHEFEELMDAMNIPENQRSAMRMMSVDKKKTMMTMHRGTSQQNTSGAADVVADIIKALDGNLIKLTPILQGCKVSLTSKPMSWIQQFCDSDGLAGLLLAVDRSRLQSQSSEAYFEAAVSCVKAFMNNKLGFNSVLAHMDAMSTLAKCLLSNNRKVVMMVLQMMAAVCIRGGNALILEAMGALASERDGGGFRFDRLSQILRTAGLCGSAKDTVELQIMVVQLINAVISSQDSLEMRVHLRNECHACGFHDFLPQLSQLEDDSMITQLKVFKEDAEDDWSELLDQYEGVQFEMDDEMECCFFIRNQLQNSSAAPYFLSILQHMCLIRDDHINRPRMYKLLEEAVSQMVLLKNGLLDPGRQFFLDMDNLSSFGNMTEQTEDTLELRQRIEEKERALDAARDARLEAELSSKTAYEKQIAELEAYITSLEATAALAPSVPGVAAAAATPSACPPVPGPPPPPAGGVPPPPPPPPPMMPGIGGPPPPPPPPMMPGMGGPPPPPPPPGMGGPPGAPPPPGMMMPTGPILPAGLTAKKKHQPKNKMKKLAWKKIEPQKIKGTIWEKLDEQDIAQMLNLSMLEETFGLKSGKKVGGESKPKSTAKPKVKLVQVLEGKKGENIDIAIRSSKLKDNGQKVTHEDIRKSLMSADSRLPVNLLEGLLNNAPTSDETEQLQAYKATPSKVGTAERLFLSLTDVPRLTARLRAMMFRAEFKEKMDFVKPGMRNVIIASQDVCVSKGLFKILQLVLLIGNYMNSGGYNAGSFGFKLTFLNSLRNTKCADPTKGTLLHFLIKLIDADAKKNAAPDLWNIVPELESAAKAKRVDVNGIRAEVKLLESGVNQVRQLVESCQKGELIPGDDFGTEMAEFLTEADKGLGLIVSTEKQMKDEFAKACAKFGEDPSQVGPSDLFGIFTSFVDSLQQTKKENERIKQAAKKAADQKAAEEKRALERRERAAVAVLPDDGKEKGIMDDLVAELASGSAFRKGKRKNRRGGREVAPNNGEESGC